MNPRPFGLAPEASALDHSAKLSCERGWCAAQLATRAARSSSKRLFEQAWVVAILRRRWVEAWGACAGRAEAPRPLVGSNRIPHRTLAESQQNPDGPLGEPQQNPHGMPTGTCQNLRPNPQGIFPESHGRATQPWARLPPPLRPDSAQGELNPCKKACVNASAHSVP